jgi:riboflavin synthase
MQHTNMQQLKKGDSVNIEFDMIGKYVNRFMESKNQLPPSLNLSNQPD